MSDLIPAPLPSAPTNPPLTPAMVIVDKQLGISRPGAGGWTPSKATVRAIGAVGITFGAMTPVFPATLPAPLGIILGALCGAVSGGCVYFAALSAGPRKVAP